MSFILYPQRAYELAKLHGYSKDYEDRIVDCNNIQLKYRFAKNIPGANVRRLSENMEQHTSWAYIFATKVKGVDINALQRSALGSPFWAYRFLVYVPGTDFDLLKESLFRDARFTYQFIYCHNRSDAEINKLESLLTKKQLVECRELLIKDIIE